MSSPNKTRPPNRSPLIHHAVEEMTEDKRRLIEELIQWTMGHASDLVLEKETSLGEIAWLKDRIESKMWTPENVQSLIECARRAGAVDGRSAVLLRLLDRLASELCEL